MRFRHFLGEGYIIDKGDVLQLMFNGVWRHVVFERTRSSNTGIFEFVQHLSEEPGVGKVELFLFLELEKIARTYSSMIRNHANCQDVVGDVWTVHSPDSISEGFPLEKRLIGKRCDGFGINLSPTGYLGVYGPVASTFDVGGMAHLDGENLVFDFLGAKRRKDRAEVSPENMGKVEALISEKWRAWALENEGAVAEIKAKRDRLIERLGAAWPVASERARDAIINGRHFIKLSDRELYSKINALGLEIDLSIYWPEQRDQITASTTEPHQAIVASSDDILPLAAVGLAEAIARAHGAYGNDDVVAWRRRAGKDGGKMIVEMAGNVADLSTSFPSLDMDLLDSRFFDLILDSFDFDVTSDSRPRIDTATAIAITERYFGMEPLPDVSDEAAPTILPRPIPRL